ncbi:MAG TPA: hypothetical protein VIK61_18110 [Acidimicrobiia bacterium]
MVPPGDLPSEWESWPVDGRETFERYHDQTAWHFVFSGICGHNGYGDDISAEEAARYADAFTEPLSFENVHTAGLFDDAGYCGHCRLAFCYEHWNVDDGYGQCPRGHGKSLDPHWHPDD